MKSEDFYYSIVVPLYNKEFCIAKTISSVLHQTYFKYELIIVDDGSTDDSCSVVESFHDERIRLVKKANGGVSSARNLGVRMAQYEYIVFLDADDWWNLEYLEKMKNLIAEYPSAKMFGSSYAEVNSGRTEPSITYNLLPSGYRGYINYLDLFEKHFISPINSSAVVIGKELFYTSISFDEQIASGEDLLVWLEVAFNYPVAYINEILSFYNKDVTNSITTKLCLYTKYFIFKIKEKLTVDNSHKRYLIDGIILRCLCPYYSLRLCNDKSRHLLQTVDFSTQPIFYRLYYTLPRWMPFLLYRIRYRIKGKRWKDS